MTRGNLRVLTFLILALLIAVLPLAGACKSSSPTPDPAPTTAAPKTTAPAVTQAPAASPAPAPATSPKPTASVALKAIKIAIMTPSTGPAAEKGSPMGHANLDAIEYFNAELSAAAGFKIEPLWLDSKYDPATVVTNINRFMDQGAVIWGTASSKEGTAAMEIANKAGFPGIVSFTAPNLYRPPQHVYGQMPDYGDDALAFVSYYMKNVWKGSGKPKFALQILNNPTGYGAKDAFTAKAAELGVEVISVDEHTATTTSEMEALTRLKAKNPDVLYISSTPAPTAVIVKNAVALGMYPGMVIASGHAGLTKALVDIAGATTVEGVYGVFPTVNWGDNVPGMAKMTEYAKKLHPNDYGNMDYITSWAQSLVMIEAVKNAVKNAGIDVLLKGNIDSWKAVESKGIQALKDYKVEGLHGPVSFTQDDNRLSKSVRVFQIKGGSISPITDWVDAPVVKYETYAWFGK